jgi:large subunit ribosomal protein L13
MEHIIDAQQKKLGRVASEAAVLLMGKTTSDFERHTVADVTVKIIHADGLAISPKKAGETTYTHYTGYPGGLVEETLKQVAEKKGIQEVLRKAIYGMLPANKLRAHLMKRLVIEA